MKTWVKDKKRAKTHGGTRTEPFKPWKKTKRIPKIKTNTVKINSIKTKTIARLQKILTTKQDKDYIPRDQRRREERARRKAEIENVNRLKELRKPQLQKQASTPKKHNKPIVTTHHADIRSRERNQEDIDTKSIMNNLKHIKQKED